MRTPACAQLHIWLASPEPAAPPPTLVAHVANCAYCRGELILPLVRLFGGRLPVDDPLPCERCQQHLAAFIDLERAAGSTRAAAAFPHVWLHHRTCAECAELYQLVCAVVTATVSPGALTADPPL
jgi:hypothetical protein